MGNLSEHFSREEFGCKCSYPDCEDIAVDVKLVKVLENVRNWYKKPVKITSSYRCQPHNEDVGGAPRSKHRLGIAADIQVKGVEPSEVFRYLCAIHPHEYGKGSYKTFTHIDVRDEHAKW